MSGRSTWLNNWLDRRHPNLLVWVETAQWKAHAQWFKWQLDSHHVSRWDDYCCIYLDLQGTINNKSSLCPKHTLIWQVYIQAHKWKLLTCIWKCKQPAEILWASEFMYDLCMTGRLQRAEGGAVQPSWEYQQRVAIVFQSAFGSFKRPTININITLARVKTGQNHSYTFTPSYVCICLCAFFAP